jgi:hypothetical protein
MSGSGRILKVAIKHVIDTNSASKEHEGTEPRMNGLGVPRILLKPGILISSAFPPPLSVGNATTAANSSQASWERRHPLPAGVDARRRAGMPARSQVHWARVRNLTIRQSAFPI